MTSLILDIFIYNYTIYATFFFLININDTNYIKILPLFIYIDLYITHTFILNTVFYTMVFILRKYYIKINKFYQFYLFNIIIIIIYISLFNLSIKRIIISLLINSAFIIFSYIFKYQKIIFTGGYNARIPEEI